MRAELAYLNDCAVRFLSRANASMCWYYYNSRNILKIFSVHVILVETTLARLCSCIILLTKTIARKYSPRSLCQLSAASFCAAVVFVRSIGSIHGKGTIVLARDL